MKRFLLGIDGGGTRSRAVLADPDGIPVAESRGRALNPLTVGWDAFRRNLGDLLGRLAVRESREAEALCAGLAGVGNREIRKQAAEHIRQVSGISNVYVITDAEAALWGAFSGEAGLLLIAGTGSICLGMNAEGRSARSGGFGYLLGDEGSGWWIAVEAVRQALKSIDGRARKTELADLFRRQFHLGDIRDIIPLLQNGDLKPVDLAAAVPEIFNLIERDPVAKEIVLRAGSHLAELVESTAVKLRLDTFALALSGGLWDSPGKVMQEAFYRACEERGIPFHLASVREPPEMGAVRYLRKIIPPL
jgi:N-acetylglucosamine kinase-like BadF-type ATPase